jgi:hypothetical protein
LRWYSFLMTAAAAVDFPRSQNQGEWRQTVNMIFDF